MDTLALSMFYRVNCHVPIIDREAGQNVSKKLFNAQQNFIFEKNKNHPFQRMMVLERYIRGGAERSPMFFR